MPERKRRIRWDKVDWRLERQLSQPHEPDATFSLWIETENYPTTGQKAYLRRLGFGIPKRRETTLFSGRLTEDAIARVSQRPYVASLHGSTKMHLL